MELIIAICSKEACRTFRISSGVTAPHAIEVTAQDFFIQDTLELLIFEQDGLWYFEEPPDRIYQIYDNGHPMLYQPIQNQSVLQIKTVHRDNLCVLVFTEINVCKNFELYSIADQTNISLGKQNSHTIQYDISGFISNTHWKMSYVNCSWTIRNMGINGFYINQTRIKESCSLAYGDVLDVFGLRILFLGKALGVLDYGSKAVIHLKRAEHTELTDLGEKPERVFFHRAPRVLRPLRNDVIELEAPPTMQLRQKQSMLLTIGPAFTMAVPMLLGFAVTAYGMRTSGHIGGIYLYTGLVTAVASALVGSLWACLNVRNQEKHIYEAEQVRQTAYHTYLQRLEHIILNQYEDNANALHSMYPSAREVCRYDEKTHVLWNRNATHEDFLMHRLGIGRLPFQADIRLPKERFEIYADALREKPRELIRKYQFLQNVPICVDLDRNRLIGALEENGESELLYTLIVQLAVCHAYTDVKLVFFLDGSMNRIGENRAFVKWLPHVWSEDKKVRFVDLGEGHPEELLYELSHICRRRMETEGDGREHGKILPHYIVLVENYKRMQEELPLHYLFEQPEKCGLTVILFAEEYETLPNECTYILQKSKYFTGAYDLEAGEAQRQRICLDTVPVEEAARLAERLAGIEIMEQKISTRLPELLTLFELFGVRTAEELEIEANWMESRPDLYLKAPVGVKASGELCYLDVHEKAHGPHGLIAGMTGSGKSEVLQTYIISMAVRYRPEEVGFFLIDYKGGGMANLFLQLPHLIGHISNLSGRMIQRAMVSIKSENERRQAIFNQHGVNHIHDYIRRYRAGEAEVPLPHIMIIIDEFAELKKEEPDFMKELISVAQVGRSLGVHLILATQKPSGTVDDNIRSNARFRLCLRVQDRQDSTDMLQKADAAYITQAGRAYFQVGNDELYELFQGAWSSAPYEENRNQYADAAALLTLTGREEYYGHVQKAEERAARKGQTVPTQLDMVIARIGQAAERTCAQTVRKLWLPMLPRVLSLETLKEPQSSCSEEAEGDIAVAIGRYDHPRQQRQKLLKVRLTEGGHHVICGMVTSGKSTFLQTLLYALVTQYTPEHLHLYLIDCSSHSLAPFQYAPHTGGFMGENNIEDIKKTIYMLHKVLQERKELLKGGNYRQYVKTVAALPAMILVIDNYAILKEKTEGCFESDLMEFSRIGEAYGIYLVATAAGFGAGDMTARMAENFRTTICLRLTDKYQYAGILRQSRVEICPEEDICGRGLAIVDGDVLEFQTALALPETEDYTRMELIREHCRRLDLQWGERKRACTIPHIPEPMTLAALAAQMYETFGEASADLLPIGWFIETAEVCVLHYEKWHCLTISGRKNTGKTNLLKLLIAEESMRKSMVYIIDSKDKKLQAFAEEKRAEITGYYTEAEEIFTFYEQLGDLFTNRNRKQSALRKAGLPERKLYLEMNKEQRCIIIIGNLSEWSNEHYVNSTLMHAEALISNLIEKGSLHNVYFAAAYTLEQYTDAAGRRIFDAYLRHHTGIHMGGDVGEERTLDFSYVSYSEQGKSLMRGQGMVPHMEGTACNGRGRIAVPMMI